MEDWDAGGSGDGGFHMGKRQLEKGEVDYKMKAGTAWSHSYLNQKPWHPLSYPNQRRKWIAEQTHANRERRTEEIAREFSQEQEFFRQTALFSNKEKEKMEIMKAVSFMYVRPPGYNAESAKAAEVSDEKKRLDGNNAAQDLTTGTTSCPMNDPKLEQEKPVEEKKSRPKDVFGRPLPTENEFEVLKNAPKLETGMPARVKPFGIEIRNVRCVRCGTFGHQSGDRECPLKDTVMPNEESRLKRDDPLTAIMAQTSSAEPVKWELKQKPGMSPPRGGFQPDDPNQQIVADEIFDEYGGFLSGGDIPVLLSNFSTGKSKKRSKNKRKHKHKSSASRNETKFEYENRPSSSDSDYVHAIKRSKYKSNGLSDSEIDRKKRARNTHDRCLLEVGMESGKRLRSKHDNSPDSDVDKGKARFRKKHVSHSSESEEDGERWRRSSDKHGRSSSDSEVDRQRKRKPKSKYDKSYDIEFGRKRHSLRNKHNISTYSEIERYKRRSNGRAKTSKRHHSVSGDSESSDSDSGRCRRRRQRHHRHDCSS